MNGPSASVTPGNGILSTPGLEITITVHREELPHLERHLKRELARSIRLDAKVSEHHRLALRLIHRAQEVARQSAARERFDLCGVRAVMKTIVPHLLVAEVDGLGLRAVVVGNGARIERVIGAEWRLVACGNYTRRTRELQSKALPEHERSELQAAIRRAV